MKIDATVIGGSIVCREGACPFSENCANHKTANVNRQESGFTPEIFEEKIKDGPERVFCSTIHKQPKEKTGKAGLVPDNIDEITTGAVYIDLDSNELRVRGI